MNDFYEKKAAVPREARSGTLRQRLEAWKEKRLNHVISSCENASESYRQEFCIFHQKVASNVDTILATEDPYLHTSVYQWLDVYAIIVKQTDHEYTGAYKDTYGLCGAELKIILDLYMRDKNESN